MSNDIKKILKMFDGIFVIGILESSKNYLVHFCRDRTTVETETTNILAVDKKTFKVSNFSYFDEPDEYREAYDNIVYKYDR